jgi:hypothetical protein
LSSRAEAAHRDALEPVDFWDYEIAVENAVVRVISSVTTLAQPGAIVLSEEHDAFGWHPVDQLSGLDIPDAYKRSIRLAGAS